MKTTQQILNEVREKQIELIRFVYIDNDGVILTWNRGAEMIADILLEREQQAN